MNNIRAIASNISTDCEERYGFLVTISIILAITVNSIKLYKLCNDQEDLFERLQNDDLTKFHRFSILKVIKRECPTLTRSERTGLLQSIIDQSKGLKLCDLQSMEF